MVDLRTTDIFRVASSLRAPLPVEIRSYRDGGPCNTSREQARRVRQMRRDAWPGEREWVCTSCGLAIEERHTYGDCGGVIGKPHAWRKAEQRSTSREGSG